MKQQLILEKIKKSLQPEQSMDSENFAPSFCLPPKKMSNQNQAEQQLVQELEDKSQASINDEESESDWPTTGSIVRVRLDAETVMTGIVTNDGAISDTLRATGFIGVQTSDGQLIEVPYPDKNVFVKQMVKTIDANKSLTASSSSSSPLSSLTASELTNRIIEKAKGIESASKRKVYGEDEVVTLSSWPTDMNSSDWSERGRTLIGKRLSKNTGMSSIGALDSDDNGEISRCTDSGNKTKYHRDDNGDNDHDNDDDDDDDDVQWVGGHETLTQKKKKRSQAAGEDSEESE